MERYIKKNSKGGQLMQFLGKTPKDWKALELYYRREWLCFVCGFIIGVLI